MFPGFESDYFRTRLTHSLEVGQVAKSIAIKLNYTEGELAHDPIDVDICELAGWCHDIGHPPFGHQGELVLDEWMRAKDGGFEGNAQTLRILSKLEKREYDEGRARRDAAPTGIGDGGEDSRFGLNLTARSLASVLKYGRPIPLQRKGGSRVEKGYYTTEKDVVKWVRDCVSPGLADDVPLKTVECQIMDLADDIAYSTYDLEDTFKAGFLDPLDILAIPESIQRTVADKVARATGHTVSERDVVKTLLEVFREDLFGTDEPDVNDPVSVGVLSHRASRVLASSGYLRTALTSKLIRDALASIRFKYDSSWPGGSQVFLEEEGLLRVEVLKHLTYEATIQSPRVASTQFRADFVLRAIIESIEKDPNLLPADVRRIYEAIDEHDRTRVLCDFVSGMTDRYALEFYGRLRSETPQSIFKPFF